MNEKIISAAYFNTWLSSLNIDIGEAFLKIEQLQLSLHSFTFYTSVSVMSSSKIEGEAMEVDSYVKHKMLNIEYLPELTEKPNDLYKAYLFAKDNALNAKNFHAAHKLIAAHLLPQAAAGVLRKTEMLVMEHKTGRIQYEATALKDLQGEYAQLWREISALLAAKLSIAEVFYYAAFVHLAFVNIHPFSDGNGRAARLLEKWFLAQYLGERAWYIQSEQYYYQNINDYYKNLARLGWFYEQIDYQKAMPFLLMLPQALVAAN